MRPHLLYARGTAVLLATVGRSSELRGGAEGGAFKALHSQMLTQLPHASLWAPQHCAGPSPTASLVEFRAQSGDVPLLLRRSGVECCG
jgi:hypothetical protein